MLQEMGQFTDDRFGLARHQPLEVAAERIQQLGWFNHIGERDDDQDQQGHDRQQRVVRDRACQKQTLVRTKRLEGLGGEGTGVL
jgi:hypothetical protein